MGESVATDLNIPDDVFDDWAEGVTFTFDD
jgi:hypothetical protein